MMVDLRSDTVTKPSQAMLNAMMSAQVGDDVFGEDPTVNELERIMAETFGFEAGLFCASGTMANQIAIKCHTQPGDEVICEASSHVYIFEGGGIAFNSGAQTRPIIGTLGHLNAEQILTAINPDDVHKARTSLVVLENTANRGGGTCYYMEDLRAIHLACNENGLKLHLDGARLFNALIATNQKPTDYIGLFNSMSICLSKGLGAPVGSVLVGSADFIKKAKRVRKVLGGGMRQAGYLAAAGIFALYNNVDRLADDHKHAKVIADKLMEKRFIGKIGLVETNIVIFSLIDRFTAKQFVIELQENDIYCFAISDKAIRMVTHLDVSEEKVNYVLKVLDTF